MAFAEHRFGPHARSTTAAAGDLPQLRATSLSLHPARAITTLRFNLWLRAELSMLGQSRLLLGLLSETGEAAAAQVELWDRSTVWQAGWDQASKSQAVKHAGTFVRDQFAKLGAQQVRERLSALVPEWPRSEVTGQPAEQDLIDYHVMKFCRMLNHAGLQLNEMPTAIGLHDLCLQIERHAVRTLAELDGRSLVARMKREPRQGFEGSTTDDLVRYVIQKTFEQLDTEFRDKSPEEQEAIAARIATALRDLPPEEQERIRAAAHLPDLTAETLRQTGRLASLGFGLSGMVSLAGFTAYTTLTSVVSMVAGAVGLHLSFGTYVMLTSGLAGLTNPFVFIPMLAGGAAWMTGKANRSIRGVLYPTFIATSVMSHTASDQHDLPLDTFITRVGKLVGEISTGSGQPLATLVARFPGLGRPPLSARLVSHVTR